MCKATEIFFNIEIVSITLLPFPRVEPLQLSSAYAKKRYLRGKTCVI